MKCLDDKYPKLKIYISELILDIYIILISSIHSSVLHVLTCLLIVSCFVGTGGFLNYMF